MVFPTFGFAFFFLAVFIGFHYVFRRNLERRLFLCAASLLFYAFWDWRYCFILGASAAANYGFGLLVGLNRDHLKRKAFLVLSVVFNVALLGFFKYYDFFADSLNGLLFARSGGGFLLPLLHVVMPVGISFYTFKAMSYVFDVYLCKMPAVKSCLDVLNYLSFFPQVASGPIVHAEDFFPDMTRAIGSGLELGSRPIELDKAVLHIMLGLLKKMVFANYLSTLLVDPVFLDPLAFHALDVFLAGLAYAVVIYCDFSGYSDMAVGIALLLGFHTPANFDSPYASWSVTNFWRRWHISFSSWLRNYLYFSLGGSRFGTARTLLALFATMLLGGLWHGASWTFLLWGAMQGAALALERTFNYGTVPSPVPGKRILQVCGTFAFTYASWIVFRSGSLGQVGFFFRSLLNFKGFSPLQFSPVNVILVSAGLAMHAVPRSVLSVMFRAYRALPLPVKALAAALFFAFLSVVSMAGIAPFIYFQF